ncbi:hypothetical protein TNCV_1761031 [Trichonephila clavipes]|nr:hypothetical protein TNCV_1761031 [Trichonephila clavipes]
MISWRNIEITTKGCSAFLDRSLENYNSTEKDRWCLNHDIFQIKMGANKNIPFHLFHVTPNHAPTLSTNITEACSKKEVPVLHPAYHSEKN